ncbi:MAG: response regulator [Acidobacteria bacterium]|nr:response regulator [Acidobacteriota bacterium]
MAHIMIVDDDPDIIQAYRMILETRGYTVTEAYSSQEAWNLLQKSTPDLMVLDCMMEEFTSGFDLAKDIRTQWPRLPILMLTSVTEHMSDTWKFSPEQDGHWLPVQRFLEKPVAPDVMVQEIEKALKESEAGSPGA